MQPPIPSSIDVSALPPNVVATGEAYNPLDPAYAANPWAFYARARREAPVCWSQRFGAFVVTGADEFMAVMKDPARFSSRKNMDPMWPWPEEVLEILGKSPGGAYPAPGLFNNDPPGHTRARALFSQVLTAGRILEMEPAIRAIAHGLVDSFVSDGHTDLVERFTYPLPMAS
jgi:cytochrome P450